ncbi:hypothetical protein L2725_01075 [Shewanella corallii]|uniref:HNH endonuclease 5 domain-containing protein n=1 Tax=Shewanella corallii TaxID=560080 RepID=A0ABT0N1S3_9GAMM|nr:hypothetical protein [Shewanella corallii]MCL2912387.1 hypothetical protein [Shewanella corallii]
MSNCQYCGNKDVLTREHIVPAYMYNFQKELENRVTGWNEVAQKMVGGEFKIKDVCGTCNNGVLSDLDEYSKMFLQDSGVFVQNYVKNHLSFTYDYDLLLRWLLKVSFNSSRTDGVHKHLFEKYIPFILNGSESPKKNNISIVAQMVAPEVLENSGINKESFLKLSAGSHKLNPFLIRICYGKVRGASGYTLRMIIIGPIVFHLLMFDDNISPGHAATEVRRIIKSESSAKFLMRDRNHILLMQGRKSWLDLYQHQVDRVNNPVNKSFKQNC